MTHNTDVFLSHNWGVDKLGRDNHWRVSRINKKLQNLGYQTWFDEDRLRGDIFEKMAEGIELTKSVIAFITQKYLDKVNGENASDNCKREFNYAVNKKTSSKIVPVIMERDMCDTSKWTGSLAFHLCNKLFIDMSGDLNDKAYLSLKMNSLKRSLTTWEFSLYI